MGDGAMRDGGQDDVGYGAGAVKEGGRLGFESGVRAWINLGNLDLGYVLDRAMIEGGRIGY